jgi:hypothetical protein
MVIEPKYTGVAIIIPAIFLSAKIGIKKEKSSFKPGFMVRWDFIV